MEVGRVRVFSAGLPASPLYTSLGRLKPKICAKTAKTAKDAKKKARQISLTADIG
jgi:hypothetical protein